MPSVCEEGKISFEVTGEAICVGNTPKPPVGEISCSLGDHSLLACLGANAEAICEVSGAAGSTILRNPLTVTLVRKTVLVSVHGNRAASKLVDSAFGRVRVSVETTLCVGPLVGAPNSATGSGWAAGDVSA